MKKLLLFITIITIISFALFSDKANEATKPYIAKFIESEIDENITIEIEEYKLDYNYITLLAKVNQKSHIKIYGEIDAISQNFNINYTIDIKKLESLKSITKTDLRGELKITGKVIKEDTEPLIIGSTNSFDGKIDFRLKDNKLNADIKKISTKKLCRTLNYPLIFSAPLSGKLNYNIQSKKGKIDSNLTDAKLIRNQLTDLVKKVTDIDLTKDTYNQTHFNAKLYSNIVEFELIAKNSKNRISIYDAKLKNNKYINAKYKINIRREELDGAIKGDIASPKVTIDSSSFIKKKAKKIFDKYINVENEEKIKSRLKDFGIDKEEREKAIDKAKDFIKGFL